MTLRTDLTSFMKSLFRDHYLVSEFKKLYEKKGMPLTKVIRKSLEISFVVFIMIGSTIALAPEFKNMVWIYII